MRWIVAYVALISGSGPTGRQPRTGVRLRDPDAAHRHLQVADVDAITFDLDPPVIQNSESNIASIAGMTTSDEIVVYAGMVYSRLVMITSAGGLGGDSDGVVAKLVPEDTSLCTDDTISITGNEAPLDGMTPPEVGATETYNVFLDVAFPYAGTFKICYRKVTDGPYDVFPHVFDVQGSLRSDYTFWCIYVLDPGEDIWQCKLAVDHVGAPQDGSWLATLHSMSDDCGTAFEQKFFNKVSTVSEYDGAEFQVHNFGKRRDGANEPIALYKVCYCPGFDADGGIGTEGVVTTCHTEAAEDFPQTIGTIVLIFGEIMRGERVITVYPTLRFDVVFTCGNGNGGCASDLGPRYKIVRDNPENDRNYFDDEAGCRSTPQVEEQLLPFNCANPADCNDVRDDRPISRVQPKFKDVQMDAVVQNMVMLEKSFDVCYCDGDCFSNKNWFKVFDFEIKPVEVSMVQTEERAWLALGYDSVQRRLDVEPPPSQTPPKRRLNARGRRLASETTPVALNTPGYIVIFGQAGAWSQDGTKTREMKVLPDADGLVTRDACLELAQSTLQVTGHLCTETVDCASPSVTRTNGHIYGEVSDATGSKGVIKIRQSGFAAVCYCDQVCNEVQNWYVAGRILVAGPNGGQTWVFSQGVAFSMNVEGVALDVTNYAMVVDGATECGSGGRSSNVYGPVDNPILVMGEPRTNKIMDISSDEAGRGTRVDFQYSHGLVDGDMITLRDIESKSPEPMDSYEDKMINTVHKVVLICDGMLDGQPCYAIAVPIFFIGAFPPLFISNALWHRSNLETYNNIRGALAGTYKVCWSHESQAEDSDYVGTAGMLVITQPPLMPAQLSLTSVEPNRGAPVIISFETGEKGRYREATGPMQLKFVFQDSVYLSPLDRDLQAANVEDSMDTAEERSQALCGKYITEIWSDDVHGFPHPDGCYMRVDKTDTSDEGKDLWELYIVFTPRNGLRAEKKYQIVMMAQAGPLLSQEEPGDGAVHVWSMDDLETNPFDVVELGKAFANKDIAVNLRSDDENDAAWLDGTGFRLMQPDNPILVQGGYWEVGYRCARESEYSCAICYSEEMCGNFDPTVTMCKPTIDANCVEDKINEATMYLQLASKDKCLIKDKAIIRVFLMPLTQWWIAERCGATCKAHPDTKCGGEMTPEPTCEVESVVGGLVIQESAYNINVLKLTLPDKMTPISSVTQHTIKIDPLLVPQGGFLPQSIPAEVQPSDGEKPHFWDTSQTSASGLMMYMEPRTFVASIVTMPGDGNMNPFRGDEMNLIYLKVVAGTTWHSAGEEGVQIAVELPEGYRCRTDGRSLEVPADLGVLGRAIPSSRGLLGPATDSQDIGYWKSEDPVAGQAGAEATGPKCLYIFSTDGIWYAKSSVYLAINVNNPVDALSQTNEKNYWKLAVSANGAGAAGGWNIPNTPRISADGLPYIDKIFAGEGDFSKSVSVLGKLSQEIVAATNFAYGGTNDMMIFFRTEQEVGLGTDSSSQIWVDAPQDYDFGRYCLVQHLPDAYYVPEPVVPTRRIPSGPMVECEGIPRIPAHLTYTRSKIYTTSRLLGNSAYGFYLRVTNPTFFVQGMLNDWKIWTYTQRDEGVDGSFQTVRQNAQNLPGDFTSWGPYQRTLDSDNFQVSIPDLRPTAGDSATEIIVFPIMVTIPSDGNVRILAPQGYRWSFTQAEFIYRSVNSGTPIDEAIIGADRDFPLSLVPTNPIIEPFNELTIEYLKEAFLPGNKYGFRTMIRVPPISPSNAPNAFTLELGYDERNSDLRTEACMSEARLVRALINGAVSYRTNIRTLENIITFSIQVVTSIPRDGGLVFTGPPEFTFEPECSPKAEIGFPELPFDSSCAAYLEIGSLVPSIIITAGPDGIPAAMYTLSFVAVNPSSLRGEGQEGVWTVHAYRVVSEKTMLDAPTEIPSFRINDELMSSRLVPAQKRPCKFKDPNDDDDTMLLPEETCDLPDWQYHRSGRSDKPGEQSSLIFEFVLATKLVEDEEVTIRLHAPRGFEFSNECQFESRPSHVFWADNPGTEIPPEFTDSYQEWPEEATTLSCHGLGTTATVRVAPGLKSRQSYVFRISIYRNPDSTPVYNYWLLEVAGETSKSMEGFTVWAFQETSVIPRDVAMSERYNPLPSPVDIYFRPYTLIPPGGRLQLRAPSGFRIDTHCVARLEPVVDPGSPPVDIPEVLCQGDINPSNNGQVLLLDQVVAENEEDQQEAMAQAQKNRLISGQLYRLTIEVANPQSVSGARDWMVSSYETLELQALADRSFIPGYAVSYRVKVFSYDAPGTVSGTLRVALVFHFAFPQNVVAGDRIVLDAPFGFILNEDGRNDCMAYRTLQGYLQRTIPTCGANRMKWALEDELLPEDNVVSVTFETINPPRTPAMNFFAVKHLKPDDTVYASRLIPGYVILPQLENVRIYLAPPIFEAVGTYSTVVLKFIPESMGTHIQVKGEVDGQAFDMSAVTTPRAIEIIHRDAHGFQGKMAIAEKKETQVTLYSVHNPMRAGMSTWDLTTFSGGVEFDQRMDQKLAVEGFPILGRLKLKPASSVRPNFYGTRRAIANFFFESTLELVAGDRLVLIRPQNFAYYDRTLMVKRFMTVADHGIGVGSFSEEEHEREREYGILLGGPTNPDTEVGFSVEVQLPDEPSESDGDTPAISPKWRFRCFFADGTPKATNDYLFEGFLLVGEIPFFVEPTARTPGALGLMRLTFDLPQSIQATAEIRITTTAPRGFQFAASCLGELSLTFVKCSGSGNVATLIAATPTLSRGEHMVTLLGSNAPETPDYNLWKLAAFIDEEAQYINFSEWPGFTLQAMFVTIKGNNQKGAKGPLFFTIMPAKTAERKAQIVITPPKKQGYILNCEMTYRVGLPKEPECSASGAPDAELIITISNATIVSGMEYTFSVGVLNPGEDVGQVENQWSVSLKDRAGAVVDSNRNIQGLTLKLFPAMVGGGENGLAWSSVLPTSISRVRIEIIFRKDIEARRLSEIQIASPDGVMFSDPDTADVVPDSFPLIAQAPFTAAGNIMRVLVDRSQPVEAGLYAVIFDVKNPSNLPNDNTWGVALIYNGELLLTSVMVGYQFGQPSPYAVGIPQTQAWSSPTGLFAVLALLSLVHW
jgi:hypothetical protein